MPGLIARISCDIALVSEALRPKTRWLVAVAAMLGMSVSYIDRQTLAAIAPSVRAALDIDHAQYGWLVSAFSLAYLVGAPAGGIVVDRVGARRGLAVALVVWSMVAGAHALAISFGTLFALRVLLGAAEAPTFPSAAQAIRRALPGARRPLAYGLLLTGSSFGAMVAAPLALRLDARFGFRMAFIVTAIIGTAWLPFWLFATKGDRLRRLPPDETPRPDGTRHVPVMSVMINPAVVRAIVALLGSAPLLMFVINWTSQYLVEDWHLPKHEISGLLMVPPLLFDAGAVAFGFWTSALESKHPHRTHRLAIFVATALAATLAIAPLMPTPALATTVFGLSAAGGGGVYVIVTADMLARVPASRAATASGMTAAAQSIAHIVSSPLAGWAIDRSGGYTSTLVVLGLVAIPASLLFAYWPVGDTRRAHA